MRIPKSWVSIIAKKAISNLLEKKLIESKIPTEQLVSVSEVIILNELMAEDRINDEVREILRQHEREIDSKRLDYRRLFEMTKQKLVKERKVIL